LPRSRIEIIDHPLIGDRHVAGVRHAVDEGDAVLAIKPVGAAVIDEGRDEEGRLGPAAEIGSERLARLDAREAAARM
jgi:hypothetical protein